MEQSGLEVRPLDQNEQKSIVRSFGVPYCFPLTEIYDGSKPFREACVEKVRVK